MFYVARREIFFFFAAPLDPEWLIVVAFSVRSKSLEPQVILMSGVLGDGRERIRRALVFFFD